MSPVYRFQRIAGRRRRQIRNTRWALAVERHPNWAAPESSSPSVQLAHVGTIVTKSLIESMNKQRGRRRVL